MATPNGCDLISTLEGGPKKGGKAEKSGRQLVENSTESFGTFAPV